MDLQLYGFIALILLLLLIIIMAIVLLALDGYTVPKKDAEPTTLNLRVVKIDDRH